MLIAGIALLVIGAGLVLGLRAQQGKLTDILGTETTTVAGLQELLREFRERGGGQFQYQAELSGAIEADRPLISELAGQECVHYRMRVDREWEEEYWETDARTGRRELRTRRGCDTMASNERAVPFFLRDATGAIRVDPEGADIETTQVVDRFEPGEHPGGQISFGGFSLFLGSSPGGGRRTLGYRFQEWLTPVGHQAYLLGTVRDVAGGLRVCRPPEGKSRFLVSLRSEEELVRSIRHAMTWLQVAIAICFLFGLGLILARLVMG